MLVGYNCVIEALAIEHIIREWMHKAYTPLSFVARIDINR